MSDTIKLLAINPGSTSTKIAVFENGKKLFGLDVNHDAAKLDEFREISDQFEYRRDMIIEVLSKEGFKLEDFTAFVGRGGGLNPCDGGTYAVNDKVLQHAREHNYHPATLGSIISDSFAKKYVITSYSIHYTKLYEPSFISSASCPASGFTRQPIFPP